MYTEQQHVRLSSGTAVYPHMLIVRVARAHTHIACAMAAQYAYITCWPIGPILGFWGMLMSRPAKFDAASFILGKEIRNCILACVDNKRKQGEKIGNGMPMISSVHNYLSSGIYWFTPTVHLLPTRPPLCPSQQDCYAAGHLIQVCQVSWNSLSLENSAIIFRSTSAWRGTSRYVIDKQLLWMFRKQPSDSCLMPR